jgi:hypothetical protein
MDKRVWLFTLLAVVLAAEGYRHRAWFLPKPKDAAAVVGTEDVPYIPSRNDAFRLLQECKFDELETLSAKHRARDLKLDCSGLDTLNEFYDYFNFDDSASDAYWESIAHCLEQWAQAHPESPTPLVTLGHLYLNFGWKARGNGWADTVTDQGWRLFGERLQKAKGYLDRAAALKIQDPCTYPALITVALGLNSPREEMESAYNRGVALEPNYLELYYTKGYYLLPRWYGEKGEWEAWLKTVADARGGEEGDILYAWIAARQANMEHEDFFRRTDANYERMQRGFAAALERWGQATPSFNLNNICCFACIKGDRETARKYFKRIGGQWMKFVWKDRAYFDRCQAWAENPTLNAYPGPDPYALTHS